jgi:hypothetical protein
MDRTVLHIAVIDDGINEELYDLGELKHNIQITPDLLMCERVGYDSFMQSHGTTCAAIIKKYAPDAVLSSVKILNDSYTGMAAQLIMALKWCAGNGIRLINLSLGTIDFKDFNTIKAAVDNVFQSGIIIVAACNNRDIYTCPASLPNVIGVKCDITGILKEGEYFYNTFLPDGIEITAFATHNLIKSSGEVKAASLCNSYAAPLITAYVHNILKEKPYISFNEIEEQLNEKSCDTYEEQIRCSQHTSENLKNEIDIPVILVYNYIEGSSYGIESKLCRLFREDGYNAIYICKEKYKEDICNGIVSIESCIKNKTNTFGEGFKEVYKLYDPDIIISGVSMSSTETIFRQNTDASIEIDINIFVMESINKDIIEKINKSNSILFLTNGNIPINECEESNTFIYTNESTFYDLYCRILKLFEIDEENK